MTPDDGESDRCRVTLGESDDGPSSAAVAIDVGQLSSAVTTEAIPRFESDVTVTGPDGETRMAEFTWGAGGHVERP